MKITGWKRTALAVVAAAAGLGGEAQALEFGNGDLVLALYGNNTEYLRNLGSSSALFSGGSSIQFNIDAADLTAVSGTETVKWALYGFSFDGGGNPTTLAASSTKALADYTPTELSAVQISSPWIAAGSQAAQMSGDGFIGKQLISKSNANSFTTWFGTDGSLAGGFPVSTAGTLGSLLHLLNGTFDGNNLSTVGHAILSADGSVLTINAGVPAPVPVPAAVFLFGSGLIGIVGIARRSMMMQR
jgi:hypothetical protein